MVQHINESNKTLSLFISYSDKKRDTVKGDDDEKYLSKVIFSEKGTFSMSGIVNRHDCQLWGSSPSNEHQEH
jgi:hypothetical protein